MDPSGSILLILVITIVLVRLALIAGKRAGILPSTAPKASWAARLAETFILLAAGVFILLLTATSRHSGGLLLVLDTLSPDFARANVLMFVGACVAALAAAAIAFRGRTAVATIVMAGVLCGYGLLLNGGDYPGEGLIVPEQPEQVVQYTVGLSDPDVHGAELWVNGVHLGSMPVTMTAVEFRQRVPFWADPPADFETDLVQTPRYGLQSNGRYRETHQRWAQFQVPGKVTGRDGHERYYAKVALGDQPGLATGSGSGSGSGGQFSYAASTSIGMAFYQRQQRLEALLDIARLSDYRVGPEWFEAMGTFGAKGWRTVRKTALTEPGMGDVIDQWATWRYGLDSVVDAQTASAAFERICREADESGRYNTGGVGGRAVELIAPHLPVGPLVDRAVHLIHHYTRGHGVSYGRAYGRMQFGTYTRHGQSGSGDSGGGGFPTSGFAVAHAVWLLHDRLLAQGEPEPNIVQRTVVPALIQRYGLHRGSQLKMRIACSLGGPTFETFAFRMLRRTRNSDDWEDQALVSIHEVNRWLYLLAHLDSPAGREFRRQHRSELLDLADQLNSPNVMDDLREVRFLLLDPDLFTAFYERTLREQGRASRVHWLWNVYGCFVDAEPVTSTDLYVDAWRRTRGLQNPREPAFTELRKLPVARRREVVEALIEEIRRDSSNLGTNEFYDDLPTEMIRSLRRLMPVDEHMAMAEGLGEATPERREQVALWLEHTEPTSPVVDVLAASENPALRAVVVGALRSHPTPDHRSILDRLLADTDPNVRAAAAKVRGDLDVLAAADPMQYSATGTASAPAP